MSSGDQGIKPFLIGSASGAAATITTAPLELVKTVCQSKGLQTQVGIFLKETYLSYGLRGCFRGLAPSLAGIVPHNGLFFCMYEPVKQLCKDNEVSDGISSAVAAMTAGGVANYVTNPIWVVKTKMSTHPEQFPTIISAFKKIYRKGPRAFMSGAGASLLGVSHVMIQFPAYEYMKMQLGGDPNSLNNIAVASVASKLGASFATYPLDVIRTQMQANADSGFQAGLSRSLALYKNSGVQGFYRGFNANSIKSVPATVITLSVFEILKKYTQDQA
jgi:solute carrier family 25 folate transporter 32